MHWRLATVLVAAAIAAAGCGGGTDDAGGSPASTTEATSAPAGVETSDTTPEPAPGSAPEDGAEAHPSDAYFALDRVLDISIEIAGEDWDTLRHQTRTLEDVDLDRFLSLATATTITSTVSLKAPSCSYRGAPTTPST